MTIGRGDPGRRRWHPSSNAPMGRIGALIAAAALCLVLGLPQVTLPQNPAADPAVNGGGGGGGGGAASGPTQAYTRELGNAFLSAALVHERLAQGDTTGARTALREMERQLLQARAGATVDEQRQILRLEDRALQLAGLVASRSPKALAASQALLDAFISQPRSPLAVGAQAPAKLPVAAGTKPKATAKAGSAARPPAAKPRTAATLRRQAAAQVAEPARARVQIASRPTPKPQARPTAAAWPVKPTPKQPPAAKNPNPVYARTLLGRGLVDAKQAQALLTRKRYGPALAEVRSLRKRIRESESVGSAWQRRALNRLDTQANRVEYLTSRMQPEALKAATQLQKSIAAVQTTFLNTRLGTASGGGGGTLRRPAATPRAVPRAVPRPASSPIYLDPTLDETFPGRVNPK